MHRGAVGSMVLALLGCAEAGPAPSPAATTTPPPSAPTTPPASAAEDCPTDVELESIARKAWEAEGDVVVRCLPLRNGNRTLWFLEGVHRHELGGWRRYGRALVTVAGETLWQDGAAGKAAEIFAMLEGRGTRVADLDGNGDDEIVYNWVVGARAAVLTATVEGEELVDRPRYNAITLGNLAGDAETGDCAGTWDVVPGPHGTAVVEIRERGAECSHPGTKRYAFARGRLILQR